MEEETPARQLQRLERALVDSNVAEAQVVSSQQYRICIYT